MNSLVTLLGDQGRVPSGSSLNTNRSTVRVAPSGGGAGRCVAPVLDQYRHCVGVHGHRVGPVGLGGSQDRAVDAFDQGAGEPDRGVFEVDLTPAQPEQLAAPGTGGGCHSQIGEQGGVRGPHRGQEPAHGLGGRWTDLWWWCPRRRRVGDGVEPHPLPANGLSQGAVQHAVDAGHSARRQRVAVPAAPAAGGCRSRRRRRWWSVWPLGGGRGGV